MIEARLCQGRGARWSDWLTEHLRNSMRDYRVALNRLHAKRGTLELVRYFSTRVKQGK